MDKDILTEEDKIKKPQTNQKKLEMLGSLISGISHEINTPMHYLENNLTFLKYSFKDLLELDGEYRQLLTRVKNGEIISASDWQSLEDVEEKAEPEYLKTEITQALEQSLEGTAMVSRLVLALKDFSHPALYDYSLTDVNKCIDTVCTISRHEWKRVADLKFDLASDLPYLFSSRDELHQVLINLIVNAAHAIGEKISSGSYDRGEITISTKSKDDKVEIIISDNGPGLPIKNLEKMFKTQFTTKKAGKGTGLGLILVQRIVEKEHGGSISVVSDSKSGTSFTILLPHREAENNNAKQPLGADFETL